MARHAASHQQFGYRSIRLAAFSVVNTGLPARRLCVTTTINRANRKATARFLSENGFPISWGHLARLAQRGEGPPFAIWGRLPPTQNEHHQKERRSPVNGNRRGGRSMSNLSFRSSARNSDQAAWGRFAKADYRKTLENQRLAILCSDMDSTAKTVALVMLEYVNAAHYYATGELLVWPSSARLGALLQLSLATIKRARRALREEGVCEARNDEGGRSETAEYVFLVEWRDRQAHAFDDRMQQFEKNRLKSEPLSSPARPSKRGSSVKKRGSSVNEKGLNLEPRTP
jgi:hypothetical protein